MAEIVHPRFLSACASTSSPVENMGWGLPPLVGIRTASLGGSPSRLVDHRGSDRPGRVGSFSDREWGVLRDPQHHPHAHVQCRDHAQGRCRSTADLRERFAKFNLELHPDKTRLIEFGRNAARSRVARGEGKPETFDFLGLTHICGKSKSGRFWVRRKTVAKRMRAKLKELKVELLRRRHQSIPEQGGWLGSVVRGHLAYYAVPGNTDAVAAFRIQVARHWFKALRRRSQRHRLNWVRMNRLVARWLPPARSQHPFPGVRFDVRIRGRSPVR